MAVQAELVLRHPGCVSESFHGATSLAQIGGDRGNDLFLLHADDNARLAEALAACEAYAKNRAEIVDRSATSIVFRGVNPPGGIIAAIQTSPCSLLWPIVYRDGLEHYTVLAPSREALRGLVEALRAHGDVRVRHLADVEPEALAPSVPLADLVSGLSPRQLEALLLAVRRGYYETPRLVTTDDLAAALGLSAATFTEHLRKAERALLDRVAGLLRQHEALARGATKKPGRPRAKP